MIKILLFVFFASMCVGLKSFAQDKDYTFQENCNDLTTIKSSVKNAVRTKNKQDVDHLIWQVRNCSNATGQDPVLGALYLLKGTDESLIKAEKKLLEAYNNGNMDVLHNLAELYFAKGDFDRAEHYVFLGEAQNYSISSAKFINLMRLKAQLFYLKNNTSEAIKIFERILPLDDTGISHYFSGHYYLIEVVQSQSNNSIDNALKHLELASNKGIDNATILLADLYNLGEVVSKNIDKAKRYYLISANAGNNKAHWNLGVIYHSENDMKSAKKHFSKAASLGNKNAISLFKQLSGDSKK